MKVSINFPNQLILLMYLTLIIFNLILLRRNAASHFLETDLTR